MSRILVLSTSYPSFEDDPSSVFISKLLAALRRRGYALTVVAPSDGTFHGSRVVGGIETVRFGYFVPRSLERLTRGAGGVPENLANSRLARFQLLPMMLMFLAVSLRRSRGADILYANWLGAGLIGAVLTVLTRKPLVVSFRGDDGYLARDRPIWRFLTRWVCRRAAAVAPVSRELVDILQGIGVPANKFRLPRFGIDTEMFHPPVPQRKASPELRVLFVGSLIPRKGLDDLLRAVARPELSSVRLTVVGDGFQGPESKKLAESLGLAGRIDWKGMRPPAEVAELMRSSDVLCLPSYMEGRPNVVNEAMASGPAVVTTRIGGIPDMVREGETALLFDPGNVDELREHLRRLAEDRELTTRMGRAGYELLRSSGITWDTTAEDFDRIFSEIQPGPPRTAHSGDRNHESQGSG